MPLPPEGLKPKRIPEAHEMISHTRQGTDARVKVELLMLGDAQRGSKMRQIPWPVVLGEVARILGKGAPRAGQLPANQNSRLERNMTPAPLRGSVK